MSKGSHGTEGVSVRRSGSCPELDSPAAHGETAVGQVSVLAMLVHTDNPSTLEKVLF